ncbi:calcium-independent phospholipase-like protein A2-gamma, C terminal part [Tribonema minus]|uniref:Calcium-independent phospholipase-like protein A2-gamma, C terminal part n=1 Tax=Tribonema minus TaxID=303371 RepID=A0A835YX58_9STRA|nr:calcium-independent phospholipase-like protein A2-gamma, C terminal part [Tribonema minus]
MLGATEWVPKTRGQKGLRILCFDGGGTRGVLTIAMLKRIMAEVGREPAQVFDIVVGTSTGAIVAALAGLECFPLAQCEAMYDALIKDIFQKSPSGGVKLALKQAFYDEENWMAILRSILGDKAMIDYADTPLAPKVAFPSTVISVNPSKLWLWRNYNYPTGHAGRYSGSYRHTVRESLRATTAAPTFFSPLLINGTLYSDGALMANNPTAVALHEAKHIYPGVPVELVVSLGTGCFFEQARDFSDPAVGWDGIVNQLISSATETENTNDIMSDLVPAQQYFRFNPRMTDMAIDETRPERLAFLKELSDRYFEEPATRAQLDELRRPLQGQHSNSIER